MSNFRPPVTSTPLVYWQHRKHEEDPYSGAEAKQINDINPVLTPMPWLQTASGMRGSQPLIDLAPSESLIRPSRAARNRTRMLSRHLGLAHNDSNAKEVYLYDPSKITSLYTPDRCHNWETDQHIGDKFKDELGNNLNYGTGDQVEETAALNDWKAWQQQACDGSASHSNIMATQEGIVLINNMLYQQYGSQWFDPNRGNGGVPDLITGWIDAVANPTSTVSTYRNVANWVNAFSLWANNMTSGNSYFTGLLNNNTFNEYFGNGNGTTVQATVNSTNKAGLAGQIINVTFDMNVIATKLPGAWTWLVNNDSAYAGSLATEMATLNNSITGSQTIEGGLTTRNLVGSPTLFPLTATSQTNASGYNYTELQNFAGIMIYYMWDIWYRYCVDSGYGVVQPSGGGGTPDPNNADCSQPSSALSCPTGQCGYLVKAGYIGAGSPICTTICGNTCGSSGGGSGGSCLADQGQMQDPNTNVPNCVCMPGYTTSQAYPKLICTKNAKPNGKTCPAGQTYQNGTCVPNTSPPGKCPDGQSMNSNGQCVPNNDPSGISGETIAIGIGVLGALVLGVFGYEHYYGGGAVASFS